MNRPYGMGAVYLCAGAVVVDCTAERHGGRSLHGFGPVPGVPGDRKGRPYEAACKSIQFYRLGIVHIAEVSLHPLTIT